MLLFNKAMSRIFATLILNELNITKTKKYNNEKNNF